MIDSRLKKGLGRGLSSLLGDATKKIETNKIFPRLKSISCKIIYRNFICFNFFSRIAY